MTETDRDESAPAARTMRWRSARSMWVAAPGGAAAFAVVAWNYSAQPMWRDEWYTYSASGRTLSQLLGLVSKVDGGLSLFYLLMHAWMLLGDSGAWMRVPAGACTVVVAVVVALVGRRIGGDAVGVVSGVLVALLPAIVDHAQEARAYPVVLAAVASTGLAMLRHLERPSRGGAAALAVLALLGSALHPIVGAPAVAGIFCGSLVAPGRARRGGIVAAGLPAGLAAAALLAVGSTQVDATTVSSFQSYLTILHLSTAVSPSLKEISVMAVLVVVAVITLARRDRPGLMVLVGWSVTPVLVITASALADSFTLARYVSASAPGVAVLVACGIVRISTAAAAVSPVLRHRHVSPPLAAAALGVLAVPLAPGIVAAHTRPYRVEDPRAGAEALSDQWRAGDAVVFFGPTTRGLTDFYAPRSFPPVSPRWTRS